MQTEGSAIMVGIDAAVVANHHVVVRHAVAGGPGEIIEQFTVSPRLEGLDRLTKRLAPYPGVVAVAEPTSMTWLPLAIALERAGAALALVGNRHAARLRGALAGKNKSDVIDGEMLSRAGEFFDLVPARIPDAAELALRRAAQRRHKAVVEANRSIRRLLSLARWAYPDLWSAFGGSRATALGVLGRWPHLGALGRAREASIVDVVAAHTRGVDDAAHRGVAIRRAARDWARFWEGRLDLDALAWETTELLADIAAGDARVARAEAEATRRWEAIWGDDTLLRSVPGMGPKVGPTVRAFLGDATQFATAKQVQAYVGLNPSNWSSGLTTQPSRAITKEGPEELRLALYQAANVARTLDPQLADTYRRLMVERNHCHTKATCALARKLVARIWATLTTGQPYELRDLEGEPITRRQAKALASSLAVPEEVRRRARARSAATHRGRLAR